MFENLSGSLKAWSVGSVVCFIKLCWNEYARLYWFNHFHWYLFFPFYFLKEKTRSCFYQCFKRIVKQSLQWRRIIKKKIIKMSLNDLMPIFEGNLLKKQRKGFIGFHGWQSRYAILTSSKLILLERRGKGAKENVLPISRYHDVMNQRGLKNSLFLF